MKIISNKYYWIIKALWTNPLEHLGARVFPDMFSLAQAQNAFDHAGDIANVQA
ncbi:MAG: hypothetical protein WCE54_21195 [Ignavibacteriaceae bacterium]